MESTDKDKIIELVEKRSNNSLFGHLKSTLGSEVLEAVIEDDSIFIWKSSYFESGALHPVFNLKFNQGKLTKISAKLNPIGRIFNLVLLLLYSSLIILFVKEYFSMDSMFWIGLIVLFLGLFFGIYLVNKMIQLSKQKMLIRIGKAIGIQFYEEESFKSKRMFLARIFLYPLCIFLIYFSLTTAIPEGEARLGSMMILISIAYFIWDIKGLLSEKTEANST